MVRRVPSKHRNRLVTREPDKDAFSRLGLLFMVGLVLASGFVYAGRQHFTALRYGYETENLRRDRDQLAEMQRRLELQRDEASSPIRLEQAAKRLGMQPLQAAQIDPLRQGANNTVKAETLAVRSSEKPGKKEVQKKSAKPTVKPEVKSRRKPI
jgi:cell division protein FtsL